MRSSCLPTCNFRHISYQRLITYLSLIKCMHKGMQSNQINSVQSYQYWSSTDIRNSSSSTLLTTFHMESLDEQGECDWMSSLPIQIMTKDGNESFKYTNWTDRIEYTQINALERTIKYPLLSNQIHQRLTSGLTNHFRMKWSKKKSLNQLAIR